MKSLAITPEPYCQFSKTGPHFFQESFDESNKIIKSQKISWPWGLGPRNYIWATWVKKTYPAISPEP